MILSKIFILGQLICIYIIFNTTDVNKIILCMSLNFIFGILGICSSQIANIQEEYLEKIEEFQKLAETWVMLK